MSDRRVAAIAAGTVCVYGGEFGMRDVGALMRAHDEIFGRGCTVQVGLAKQAQLTEGGRMLEGGLELGVKVVDRVTGFRGTVTARVEYLGDATPQYRVEAERVDGRAQEVWTVPDRLLIEQ